MTATKALAALGIVVAGAVVAFAIYTFGWHDEHRSSAVDESSVRMTHGHRVYTLRSGDIIRRPTAGTQCVASGEGGFPNLFCTRMGGGRHQVIFYKDSVLVWPLDCARCGPDGPVFTYTWEPRGTKTSATRP